MIKTAIVSCSDDHVEREIQTDPVEHENKFNQWPDDMMVNYNKDRSTYQRKKKRENQALGLETFMAKAGPLMEKVIDRNDYEYQMSNRAQVIKRNAVELYQTLKFPQEVLYLFADQQGNPARIDRITSMHMFESQPQSKCAIAYRLQKHNGEYKYLAVVYFVQAN